MRYSVTCLTKPFNSGQMVLIGDPLYRPFKTVM